MTQTGFIRQKAVAIGEAMIEMAVVGESTYRRSFAGDTFNTIWHMSQILPEDFESGFVTRLGKDSVSEAFIDEMHGDGLDVTRIGRDATRTMGLYMISLDGVERSFQYWRDTSSARRLADDPAWLAQVLENVGLIHVSGITLAILSPAARETLWNALEFARAKGAKVCFDPNVRPRLWGGEDEIRETMVRFLQVTDIAVPSFDDEQALWGDQTPTDTLERVQAAGVQEVVVKNGANPLLVGWGAEKALVPTPPVSDIRDTSGAGDAFNAGYLSARMQGASPVDAVAKGQAVSGEVIQHFGARIPKERMRTLY